jgi:hypothetical protein
VVRPVYRVWTFLRTRLAGRATRYPHLSSTEMNRDGRRGPRQAQSWPRNSASWAWTAASSSVPRLVEAAADFLALEAIFVRLQRQGN